MFYRVSYKDSKEGIYEVLKQELIKTDIGKKNWDKFLNSKDYKWLPKIPNEYKNNLNYFTPEGLKKFNKLVRPYMIKYLNSDSIVEESFDKIDGKIIYRDKFQVATDKSKE